MYKEFGKTKDWRCVLIPSIAFTVLFLPGLAMFILIAMQKTELSALLVTLGVVAASIFFPLRHLRNLYIFPRLEVDENFIIANEPFQNRSVYTLKKVTYVKPFLKSVFFLHNNFPVILNMNPLTKDERIYIIGILNGN